MRRGSRVISVICWVMRGTNDPQTSMVALISMESLVPTDHPLRRIRPLADEALRRLAPVFDEMYAAAGRPSVPPERLLKGLLLMALFGIRSERMLCEQLAYNMLFRWFLDMNMTEAPFDASVYSKNRRRFLEHDIGGRFLAVVVEQAREGGFLSSDHFTVDGTMIEAWGSTKSFRPKDEETTDNNGFGDFRGTTRSNETHESKTDPEARLWRKGAGREAKLAHMGHVLMENRHGLVVDAEMTEASGFAEREAALAMLDRERERRERVARKARRKDRKRQRRKNRRGRRLTLAADKAYDTRDFVDACRERNVTPHVAQNTNRNGGSSIDDRTTRTGGYGMSQKARMLVEKIFGWSKAAGGARRSRFRGRERTRLATFVVFATYDLLRLSKLQIAS
jgi:transposase